MADFWGFIRKAKEIYSWYSFAVGGVALATIGGAWLVSHGIPWPLAAMAAYCTIAAAMFVALIPTFRREAGGVVATQISKPNYSIWRHRAEYYLYEAAYLLADMEPSRNPALMAGDVAAWFNLLSEAIKKNELRRIQTAPDDNAHIFIDRGYEPHFDTRIDITELRRFCSQRGISAPFLRG
jgi:hypothetical protein